MLHLCVGCEDGLGTNGSKSWIPESKASFQALGKWLSPAHFSVVTQRFSAPEALCENSTNSYNMK